MKARKPAAFVAAMSVLCCILFGGCGGGGGGVPPQVLTFVVGTVVDEAKPPSPIKDATVNVPDKPAIAVAMTGADGKFRLDVTGQTGLLLLEVRHPSVGVMQQLVNLADVHSVGNTKELTLTSPLIIKRNYREVHLEEAPIRVAGATLLEYGAADDPKPISISVDKVLAGPQNLTLGYEYKVGDPRVVLEDYVGHWYLYPSDEGRVIASAVYEGPRPDRTRVFVTLVLVKPTDGTPPTVMVEPIPSTVSGTLIIKGTAIDGQGTRSEIGIPVIELTELTELTVVEDSRDYDDYHFEGPPSGIQSVTLNYNGQDHPITPDTNGSFSVAVNTTTLPDGAITFKMSAVDKANNASEVKTLTTVIDNVPDPKPDPWDEMATTPSKLVMVDEVDEPARYIGDYWKYDGTIKFENISADEKNQILVYAGSVIAYPRDGDPYVWAPHAWNNGRSTYSPQGYWYATGLSDEFWRFDPRTNKLDHVTLDRPGTSWMCKADNTGAFWVYWGNGHFTCLSADLKTVLKDLDTDATDVQGFAADWGKDTLVYARLSPDHTATEIVRRRISTVEVQVLESYPNIGIGGIEFDPTHGQVLVNGALDKGYLIQLGKKDGQWGELYRTPLSIPADQLVRGATFGKYYTSHSDWKVRGWQYRPL